MSVVTNLLLAVAVGDDCYERSNGAFVFPPGLAAVRAWCQGETGDEIHRQDRDLLRWPAASVGQVAAGTKDMECGVYAWGANYLDLKTFLEVVRTAPWRHPDQVQVFVRDPTDDRFRFYNLTAARAWEPPAPEPAPPLPRPDLPAAVATLAAMEPGARKLCLEVLAAAAPGLFDDVVGALNQRLLAAKHAGEPTPLAALQGWPEPAGYAFPVLYRDEAAPDVPAALPPGTVVRVTDRFLEQIGATAPTLCAYLRTLAVDRLACLHAVSPYRFALTFPGAPVVTDPALSAELDRLVDCDDPVKLFELCGEPLGAFVVAAPGRATAEPATAHTLPFGAVPPVTCDEAGTAVPLYCVVMGGVYFPELDTAAKIGGLVRPLPALVRHQTLASSTPLPRLVAVPDQPGRFTRDEDDPITDALGYADFEVVAGDSPEAVAAEVANRVRRVLAAAPSPGTPMTLDALGDAIKAYVASHDYAEPTTIALTAAQWATVLAWPEAGNDWRARPPETLLGLRLVATNAPRFALGGDDPPLQSHEGSAHDA